MANRNSSIKYYFVMLSLCSSLNQLFSKALSAVLSKVSSTGILVKSENTSYDTKGSCSLIYISWSSLAKRNMSLMMWSLTKKGFSFSSSHFASLLLYIPEVDSFGVMANFFSWVFARQ